MFSYSTKVECAASDDFPGVKFTLRKMSLGRRIQMDAKLATQREQYRLLSGEYGKALARFKETEQYAVLLKRRDEFKWTEEQFTQYLSAEQILSPLGSEFIRLSNAMKAIEDEHFKPPALRTFLGVVDGIEIDGKNGNSITADLLLSEGPPELVDEIYRAINEHVYLSERDLGESKSPTTSSAPEGGATNDSSVPTASA